jgi:hypothetical protein
MMECKPDGGHVAIVDFVGFDEGRRREGALSEKGKMVKSELGREEGAVRMTLKF